MKKANLNKRNRTLSEKQSNLLIARKRVAEFLAQGKYSTVKVGKVKYIVFGNSFFAINVARADASKKQDLIRKCWEIVLLIKELQSIQAKNTSHLTLICERCSEDSPVQLTSHYLMNFKQSIVDQVYSVVYAGIEGGSLNPIANPNVLFILNLMESNQLNEDQLSRYRLTLASNFNNSLKSKWLKIRIKIGETDITLNLAGNAKFQPLVDMLMYLHSKDAYSPNKAVLLGEIKERLRFDDIGTHLKTVRANIKKQLAPKNIHPLDFVFCRTYSGEHIFISPYVFFE